jgi:hypothetical protein
MPLDYANATIDNRASVGPVSGTPAAPPGTPAVQPPIGYDKLTAANTEMWNGHIGSELGTATAGLKTAVLGGTPTDGSSLVAVPGTLGRDKAGALMTWASCVAGCAAGVTGTIAGTPPVFTAGAGAAVSQSVIPANGMGWFKN